MKVDMQILKSKQNNNISTVKIIAVVIMFALAFAVFMFPAYETMIGPMLTMLMLFLSVTGYADMVIALIVVANDALGTMLFGSLSFPYLLTIIILLKLLIKRSFSVDSFVVMSLILLLESFVVGDIGARFILYSVLFVLALNVIGDRENSTKMFYQGVAISVFIIALHTCLTGGVEFVDVDKMNYVRKGILGVGIGDPNFSAYLLVAGLICTWFDSSFKRVVKIIFSVTMIYAFLVTASISGIIALSVTGVFSLYINNKNKLKSLIIIALIGVLVFAAVYAYINYFPDVNSEPLDTYIDRIMEKISLFKSGDFASATTGRTTHLTVYFDHIVNLKVFSFLFGGNSLFVSSHPSHNTFIGIVLQTGFIGFLVFILLSLRKSIMVLCEINKSEKAKRTLVLILLSLVMSFSLSFYHGSLWALYMYFMLHNENTIVEKIDLNDE